MANLGSQGRWTSAWLGAGKRKNLRFMYNNSLMSNRMTAGDEKTTKCSGMCGPQRIVAPGSGYMPCSSHPAGEICNFPSRRSYYLFSRNRIPFAHVTMFQAGRDTRLFYALFFRVDGANACSASVRSMRPVAWNTLKRRFHSSDETMNARKEGSRSAAKGISMLGVPIGTLAGTFGSILGVGGGVIMVPLLTCKPMSMQARQASATSLVAVLGTGLVSALLYFR
eukprot:624107-Hanusia_phi.AAC.4